MHTLAVVIAVLLLAAACGDDDPPDRAVEVLEAHFDAFNDGDLDAVMDTFTDNSVLLDHPSSGDPELVGPAEIEPLMVQLIGFKGDDGSWDLFDIDSDGTTVEFSYRFTNGAGEEFCNTSTMTVEDLDGWNIADWWWPTDDRGATCAEAAEALDG
jgi:hypothetical protein